MGKSNQKGITQHGLTLHVNTNVAALSANGSSLAFLPPESAHEDSTSAAALAPKKKGWQASAATQAPPRPIRRAYRDQSANSSATSLGMARKPAGGMSRQEASTLSLNMNSFPGVPSSHSSSSNLHDQMRAPETFNEKLKAISRKMSFAKADPSQIDLSLTSEENERNTGLGIHAATTTNPAPHDNISRRPSLMNRSIRTTASGTAATSALGDNVGFAFKTTTTFIHPHRQTPRSYSVSRSRSQSYAMYSDEAEEDYADRMNSVTSDGGWKSGWSMHGGSQQGEDTPGPEAIIFPTDFPAPAANRNSTTAIEDDVGPDEVIDNDDVASDLIDAANADAEDVSPVDFPKRSYSIAPDQPTIFEEPETSDADDLGPTDVAVKVARPASPGSQKSKKSTKSTDMEDSPHTRNRSRSNTGQSSGSVKRSSNNSSPFEKALNLFQRDADEEDPASRAASIRAARAAFEQREAAKQRKAEMSQAKREEWKRRKSETVDWLARRRKTSIAVDSAIDSATSDQRTPVSDVSVEGSGSASDEESPRHVSISTFTQLAAERPLASNPVIEETPAKQPEPVSQAPVMEIKSSIVEVPVEEEIIDVDDLCAPRKESCEEECIDIDGLTEPARQESTASYFPPVEYQVVVDRASKADIHDRKNTIVEEHHNLNYEQISEDVSPGGSEQLPTPSSLWPPISYEPIEELGAPTPSGESMLWPPIDYTALSATSSPRPQTGFTTDGSDGEQIRPQTPAKTKSGKGGFLKSLPWAKSRLLKV